MKTLENTNRRKDRIYSIFNYDFSDIAKTRSNFYSTGSFKRFSSLDQNLLLNSVIEKKMKEVTLSIRSYNNYMNSYKKLTQTHTYKSPDIAFYPLTKNEKFLPIAKTKYFSYSNLHNKNYNLNINLDNTNYKTIESNKKSKNFFNLISNKNNNINENKNDVIFEYFIGGSFLRDQKIFKLLGLENAQLTYEPMTNNILKYINDYLTSLKETKNYDYTNEKEYIYKYVIKCKIICFRRIILKVF